MNTEMEPEERAQELRYQIHRIIDEIEDPNTLEHILKMVADTAEDSKVFHGMY